MPLDARGIDNDPGWINRKFAELKREIEGLRSERRAAATSVETGNIVLANGGSLVVDGGDVLMLDDDGSELFRIGTMQYGDRGLKINREGGSTAFEMRKPFSNSTSQRVYVRTDAGDALLSEESLANGLSRPFLPIPLLPVSATSAPLTIGPWGPEVVVNSTSWTTTHQAWWSRHNAFGMFRCRVAASDLTTAAEVQVINASTGNPLARFFQPAWLGTRPTGSTGYTEVVSSSGLVLPGSMHSQSTVAVQVRRTAGSGTLTVAVPESRGWDA